MITKQRCPHDCGCHKTIATDYVSDRWSCGSSETEQSEKCFRDWAKAHIAMLEMEQSAAVGDTGLNTSPPVESTAGDTPSAAIVRLPAIRKSVVFTGKFYIEDTNSPKAEYLCKDGVWRFANSQTERYYYATREAAEARIGWSSQEPRFGRSNDPGAVWLGHYVDPEDSNEDCDLWWKPGAPHGRVDWVSSNYDLSQMLWYTEDVEDVICKEAWRRVYRLGLTEESRKKVEPEPVTNLTRHFVERAAELLAGPSPEKPWWFEWDMPCRADRFASWDGFSQRVYYKDGSLASRFDNYPVPTGHWHRIPGDVQPACIREWDLKNGPWPLVLRSTAGANAPYPWRVCLSEHIHVVVVQSGEFEPVNQPINPEAWELLYSPYPDPVEQCMRSVKEQPEASTAEPQPIDPTYQVAVEWRDKFHAAEVWISDLQQVVRNQVSTINALSSEGADLRRQLAEATPSSIITPSGVKKFKDQEAKIADLERQLAAKKAFP